MKFLIFLILINIVCSLNVNSNLKDVPYIGLTYSIRNYGTGHALSGSNNGAVEKLIYSSELDQHNPLHHFELVEKSGKKYFRVFSKSYTWYQYQSSAFGKYMLLGCTDHSCFFWDYNKSLSRYPIDAITSLKPIDVWYFTLHPYYKLTPVFKEFSYDQSFEEMILSHATHVDLLEVTIIRNPTNATLEQELENSVSKRIETKTSWSVNFVHGAEAHVEAGFSFKAIFNAGAGTSYHWSEEEFHGQEHTESQEVTYRINRKIIVPPQTSVKVVSYVNWINNLELPFTAEVEFGALGPVINNERTSIVRKQVEVNAVNSLMKHIGFSDKGSISKREDVANKKIIYTIDGVFKGSFGLNSVFSAEPIDDVEAGKLIAQFAANGELEKKVKILTL